MAERVLVINPNSDRGCSAGICDALAPLRMAGGPAVDVATLAEGPDGIYTNRQVAFVVEPLMRLIEAERARTDAFVIACYSDPGLEAAREAFPGLPVFGIRESSVAVALARGDRFGMIAAVDSSLRRHRKWMQASGFGPRLAASEASGLSIAALAADPAGCRPRLVEIGKRLVAGGADVIITACAGMSPYRALLEQECGVAVVDPVQAAGMLALGAARLAAAARQEAGAKAAE
ncbi:MAG: Asp/Glu racemase [Alphaproteobacteria bacterium]|nr:Asp/Glu racemase [Alphaproteobacteria bacterium]